MEETLKSILAELEMIRKLKIVELVDAGYSQSKLGTALGISQSTVSRLIKGDNSATADSSSN